MIRSGGSGDGGCGTGGGLERGGDAQTPPALPQLSTRPNHSNVINTERKLGVGGGWWATGHITTAAAGPTRGRRTLAGRCHRHAHLPPPRPLTTADCLRRRCTTLCGRPLVLVTVQQAVQPPCSRPTFFSHPRSSSPASTSQCLRSKVGTPSSLVVRSRADVTICVAPSRLGACAEAVSVAVFVAIVIPWWQPACPPYQVDPRARDLAVMGGAWDAPGIRKKRCG